MESCVNPNSSIPQSELIMNISQSWHEIDHPFGIPVLACLKKFISFFETFDDFSRYSSRKTGTGKRVDGNFIAVLERQ